MKPMNLVMAFAVAFPALALGAGIAGAEADDGKRHCFFVSEFNNWKAADEKTLYIRVGVKRFFRLDLAASCRTALWPDAVMINKWRGSTAVCSHLDWDVKIAQHGGDIPQACLVTKMTELTQAEADALPRKVKP
jgi:hypothetical protein